MPDSASRPIPSPAGSFLTGHLREASRRPLLVAGLETTAAALQWALILLAQHSEALARVRSEHQSVCGSEPPRLEQLPSMPFTRMVIDETLRLYPPVSG